MIAEATVGCLTAHVEVPGVVFLSGGMSDEHATSRLNEMNRIGTGSVLRAELLLRTGAAGAFARGLARGRRERRRRSGGAGPPGPHERPGADRCVPE